MTESWLHHDREEKRRREKKRTENPDLNETYSHQGNFFFSTSGYIELILFYTTINPLYIYHKPSIYKAYGGITNKLLPWFKIFCKNIKTQWVILANPTLTQA